MQNQGGEGSGQEKAKKGPGFLPELLLIKFWPDGRLGQNKYKRWSIISSNERPEGLLGCWQLDVQATSLVWEADVTLPRVKERLVSESNEGRWNGIQWNFVVEA